MDIATVARLSWFVTQKTLPNSLLAVLACSAGKYHPAEMHWEKQWRGLSITPYMDVLYLGPAMSRLDVERRASNISIKVRDHATLIANRDEIT
jgi:hypothetical protein